MLLKHQILMSLIVKWLIIDFAISSEKTKHLFFDSGKMNGIMGKNIICIKMAKNVFIKSINTNDELLLS